jgi:hypothetical protein
MESQGYIEGFRYLLLEFSFIELYILGKYFKLIFCKEDMMLERSLSLEIKIKRQA